MTADQIFTLCFVVWCVAGFAGYVLSEVFIEDYGADAPYGAMPFLIYSPVCGLVYLALGIRAGVKAKWRVGGWDGDKWR